MILAIMVGMSLVVGITGCADPTAFMDPIIYAVRGRVAPNAEVVKSNDHTDFFSGQQLSGKKPEYYPTWKAFWLDWYQLKRKYSSSPEQAQQEIDYTHLALQRAGLPTYDQ